jgi:hypothetical protein
VEPRSLSESVYLDDVGFNHQAAQVRRAIKDG